MTGRKAAKAVSPLVVPPMVWARLMTWMSPSFPVGSFSYSHGLEYAIESGLVHDRDSLTGWVDGILRHGAGRMDSALLREAWELLEPFGDEEQAPEGLAEEVGALVAKGQALCPSKEIALESLSQGRAFLATLGAVWPHPVQSLLAGAVFPVAVGGACALAKLPLLPVVTAASHAFAANLVSAGTRILPLGQTDSQRCMAALEPVILAEAEACLERDPEDAGSAAMMVDWCSARHETQITRLFRS